MSTIFGYLFSILLWVLFLACVAIPPIWLFYHGVWLIGILSIIGCAIPTLLLIASLSAMPDLGKAFSRR